MGVFGMAVALIATIIVALTQSEAGAVFALVLMVVAILVGAIIGIIKALRVQMTGMPELVAMLHSFVGAAAVLVGFNSFLATPGADTPENAFHMGEVGLAVFIGAVTLTGSIVAYLKLSAKISGKPRSLPGHNVIIVVAIIAALAIIGWFATTKGVDEGLVPLAVLTVLSLVLGAYLVMAVGGGDMPVIVSMLNSYSGWQLPWRLHPG